MSSATFYFDNVVEDFNVPQHDTFLFTLFIKKDFSSTKIYIKDLPLYTLSVFHMSFIFCQILVFSSCFLVYEVGGQEKEGGNYLMTVIPYVSPCYCYSPRPNLSFDGGGLILSSFFINYFHNQN